MFGMWLLMNPKNMARVQKLLNILCNLNNGTHIKKTFYAFVTLSLNGIEL